MLNHPQIVPLFDFSSDPSQHLLYCALLRGALQKILPTQIFSGEEESCQQFQETLPLVTWLEWEKESLNLSVFLLCRARPHAGKFFHDMMTRWLLPGKPLNVGLFFTTEFKLPEFGCEVYTFAELVLHLHDQQEFDEVRHALPILEAEIQLGATSVYHASRILEIKGLSVDEKTVLIQEKISALHRRRPLEFDDDIFSQMQHFFVSCHEEFKASRDSHHMSRIISVLYLFHKRLKERGKNDALLLKLMRTKLHQPLGIKPVLALFLGLNFLQENELFEERHLLKALCVVIPHLKILEESCFFQENKEERIKTIYVEVQKEDEEEFSLEEIQKLRYRLPEEIKAQVERFTRSVFMPRNEEEVMRNIITLSKQVKYARDLPHVILSFDGQLDDALAFSVIIVRVTEPDLPSFEEIFKEEKGPFKFVFDRIKKIGKIRGKYFKEACVIRVKMPARDFLRKDRSVDFYRARREIIKEIEKRVGEVRDFNGGMLVKQMETLMNLKGLLGELAKSHEFLLENFFHAIFPIEWRSVLDPEYLRALFELLLEVKDNSHEERGFDLRHAEPDAAFVVMIALKEPELESKIYAAVAALKLNASKLVSLHLKNGETLYLGYIYFCSEESERAQFLHALLSEFQLATL